MKNIFKKFLKMVPQEKMFKTEDKSIYYRCKDKTWFIEKANIQGLKGWTCIGSIDSKKINYRNISDFETLLIYIGRQIASAPPKEFVPYFEVGNYPLTLKEPLKLDKYAFHIGPKIIETYKWM